MTEGYTRDGAPMGVQPGFVARELAGVVDWRPCYTCNRERWSAWQAGETAPATTDDQPEHGTPPSPAMRVAWRAALYRPPAAISDNESLHERARKRAQAERLRAHFPDQEAAAPDDDVVPAPTIRTGTSRPARALERPDPGTPPA